MPTRKALLLTLLTPLTVLAVQPATGADPPAELLVPLTGTEPAEGSPAGDLAALAGWLGDARVVGLGESIHGVHDFHRLAHRIFAHLVERQGFDVFALEISQAHAARLNEFVEGRRDDLDALMAGRWWTAAAFYDQALRELLLWMRRYNETAASPIHFAGFDLKQPSFAIAAVIDGLRELDPEAAAEAERLYSRVSALGGLGVFPNVYGFSATLSIPLPPRTGTRPLRIGLKARGRGVSHGWVGLSVEGAKPGPEGPGASLYLASDKLSGAWAPLDLETEVADHVDEVRLVIFHRGNGTVWFDGLSLALDGQHLEPDEGLEGIRVQPLAMPLVQAMDYESSFDDQVSYAGGRSLRVECDPAVDEALDAARAVDASLQAALAAAKGRVPSSREVWLRQMSRLVLQATEYRTLVENNRDVFMAENVAWLQKQGFPGSRVLVLAHSSHTNRQARGRGMGLVLAEEYGEQYKTATMLALSGESRYFGDPRIHGRDAELELRSLTVSDTGSLAQRLGALAPGDFLFHLQGASRSAAARERLDWGTLPVGELADVAILIRTVRPLRLP